jgi:hypothetical protein
VPTSRLEAFSDGVIAILITVMVLDLKTPEDATLGALLAAIVFACLRPAIADALYVAVAVGWLVPDRRIEKPLREVAAR